VARAPERRDGARRVALQGVEAAPPLAALAAALSGLVVAAVLGPLAPALAPSYALPAALATALLLALLVLPLAAPRAPLHTGPLLVLAALPAALPAWVVSSAEPRGALLSAAALLALSLVGGALARLSQQGRALAVGLLLALTVTVPLARFSSTALMGEERPALRLLSPVEVPLAALASRPSPEGPHAEATTRPHPEGLTLTSLTAGLFRPGHPVEIAVQAPVLLGGEAPWFMAEGAGALFPTFHERPAVGGRVDWQTVKPWERLRFLPSGGAPERRRTTDGWALRAKAIPTALSVQEAFDDLPSPGPAWRALRAARPGPRAADPALDPDAYARLPPPAFPEETRRRLAEAALMGGLGLAAVLLLLRRAAGGDFVPAALAVTLLASIGIARTARPRAARAVVLEESVLRLLPGESEGAREDRIDVAAPAASAHVSFTCAGAEGLTPVLFQRPEPRPYAVHRTAKGEVVPDLRLPAGGRRLFRALAPHALAGPIEATGPLERRGPLEAPTATALPLLNRTGLDIARWFLLEGDRIEEGAPVADGAAFGPGLGASSLESARSALERSGRAGASIARALEREFPPDDSPRRVLVAVLSRPLTRRVTATTALASEALPGLIIMVLKE